MQSMHSRMRRAVEKENKDIDRRVGAGNKPRRKTRRRKPFNICSLLLVLSPILFVGAIICVSKQIAIWSRAEADLENLEPIHEGTAKHQMESPKTASNKLKRLRNGQTAEENNVAKKLIEDKEKKVVRIESKFLVLTTKHGNIKITLRPDLSQGSVDYIHKLVESYGGNGKRCIHCNLYRAEKPGILQGIMAHEGVVDTNTVRGDCPPGFSEVHNDCPAWDKHCGCHGPVMTRGAVAWAAGQAGGPDFFIDNYPAPANWWGTQHTNFGLIEDESSLKVIDAIFELPVDKKTDMTFLKERIHFDLVLE